MKHFIFSLLISITLLACQKNNDKKYNIDVTAQCYYDFAGNSLTSNGICSGTNFNNYELDLFKSLDTVNLNDTQKPDSQIVIKFFPNPFYDQAMLHFESNSSFTGKMVFKYVIVNNQLDVLQRNLFKVTGLNSMIMFSLNDIPSGKYRLYMTLSAENNNHFFTKWINIEKQ
jgi:hypothetical protein